jgi:HicA toxin of bacterial toxin-antitoxin,
MPKLQGIAYLRVRAVNALEKAGFTVLREGKHTIMTDGIRILVLPRHNPINAITMGGIVRDAGLTLEQFKELL